MASTQSPVQFIPMTCPNCGGEMMISSKIDQAICNYCGKSFLVVKDAEGDGPTAKNFLKLANSALLSGNNSEAYSYFTRILEIEPNNREAWYGKARTVFWHLPFQNPLVDMQKRIDEAKSYFEKAVSNAPQIEIEIIENDFNKILLFMYGEYADICSDYFEKEINMGQSSIYDIISVITTSSRIGSNFPIPMSKLLNPVPKIDKKEISEPMKKLEFLCKWMELLNKYISTTYNNSEGKVTIVRLIESIINYFKMNLEKYNEGY